MYTVIYLVPRGRFLSEVKIPLELPPCEVRRWKKGAGE
jgi:hypothetical protein